MAAKSQRSTSLSLSLTPPPPPPTTTTTTILSVCPPPLCSHFSLSFSSTPFPPQLSLPSHLFSLSSVWLCLPPLSPPPPPPPPVIPIPPSGSVPLPPSLSTLSQFAVCLSLRERERGTDRQTERQRQSKTERQRQTERGRGTIYIPTSSLLNQSSGAV